MPNRLIKNIPLFFHELLTPLKPGKKQGIRTNFILMYKLYHEINFQDHFETFGSIVNVEQPYDKQKNERKNFCFITFEKEEAAKQLLKLATTTINGVELDIKRVTIKVLLFLSNFFITLQTRATNVSLYFG